MKNFQFRLKSAIEILSDIFYSNFVSQNISQIGSFDCLNRSSVINCSNYVSYFTTGVIIITRDWQRNDETVGSLFRTKDSKMLILVSLFRNKKREKWNNYFETVDSLPISVLWYDFWIMIIIALHSVVFWMETNQLILESLKGFYSPLSVRLW